MTFKGKRRVTVGKVPPHICVLANFAFLRSESHLRRLARGSRGLTDSRMPAQTCERAAAAAFAGPGRGTGKDQNHPEGKGW